MKAIKVLLLVLSLFQIIHCQETEEKKYFYRCGADDNDIKPIPLTNTVPVKEDKRRLNAGEFKDFKIYLDLINIKNDIKKFHLEEYEELFIESLNKAVETLESLLQIKSYDYGYIFTDQQIINISISDWNKTIIGTNAIGNSGDLGIDLFIFGRFDDQMDEHTLASAGPRYMDKKTYRPIVGIVNINTNVNYSKIHSKEYFQSIIIHEFTHILGFLKSYFNEYIHNIFTIRDENGLNRFYINSSRVISVAKKYFNCSDIDGVELEEYGGTGTAGSHWEARILLGDYMNGVVYPEEQVISEFTLALLEDTGYYKANYYTGGLMRYGKNKGCDFLKNRCVDSNHEINPFFENEFYDSIKSPDNMDASCSSGRQSRTYFAWWVYSSLPSYYRHFTDETYGGFSPADYCPVSREYYKEVENAYYTGSCSTKGNGGYGTRIIYRVPETVQINETHYSQQTNRYYYTSEYLQSSSITGETYSDHSFCYQSSLIKNNINFDSSIVRAICYESFCSDLSLTVKINEDYLVCPRAGGKIEVEGYKGFFLCPDYNLICSGSVICNDMFDCVEKKSTAKEESYIYDYTIKTSQNVEDAEYAYADEINNYELSENGICPKDCKHCYENNTCIKCRNNYDFLGSKKNLEIRCLSNIELSKGYYKENNISYPCMKNCDVCSNDDTCETCSEGFDYWNGKCIKKTENCQEYGNDGMCAKCKENFAFKEDNRTLCINIENNFDNYYTKDEGISYYPCADKINYCSKCYYDNMTLNINCYLCNTNYALYEKDNLCFLKNNININKTFYYLNETHLDKCSNVIDNCAQCDNKENCLKCQNDFYMINNNKNNCIPISNIEINGFYLNEEKNIYYSCNDELYHDIKNCKVCQSKNTCSLCQENFTFINGNKTICIDKENIKNKYIQDPLDISNYIKCEKKFDNCDTCNNNHCISCIKDFVFINDDFLKCVLKSSLNLNYYFSYDNITYYSCKEAKYKNLDECKFYIPETTIIELIPETTTPNIIPKTETIPKTNTIPKTDIYQIFILQVRIINKKLTIYITLTIKVDKNFHIKLSVDITKFKSLRNLQETQNNYEIDLYLNNDDPVEPGSIVSLSSEEKFDDNDRIVLNKKQNDESFEMKVLNDDNKILDTEENEKMIEKNEIVDFSKINTNSNYKINEYHIESSTTGCNFNLISKNDIKENEQNIVLNFIDKDNTNNNINVKCSLVSDNQKNIPCSLEQEFNNKNYALDSYVGSNEGGLFYIYPDKDTYQLSCSKEKPGKKNYWMIIGIIAGGVVAIIIIIVLIICCKKKTSNNQNIQNTEKQLNKIDPTIKSIPVSFNNLGSSARGMDVNKNTKNKKNRKTYH